ncbi:tRNA pseudouridine(55) synthase TruB [Metabacillus sediminilitoris]|uniref:tRNA pseudouridine synthase B n=1 Tax=Metabacillus sediminilitoris TaxID=2567941 RepID=A0A4S4CAU8_9BACI|nr:tRNA pseudouridine(55) synthase TruB [Metabacillus sediminilitoris]QGQ46814.1 tRNA pseudouridine(55) synthase TruB [Metabacillus sediminilitoris]THF82962.1 tRNA pseudouridine(55) synthase TruB [Metabacillus sediminilitoris]
MEGVLLLNKPAGMTSHDCVAKMRKLAKTKKVGHTGTLDPDVTGVLPICLGRATKIVEYLTASSKTYEAEITIGYSTTTEDSSGEEISRKSVNPAITKAEIQEVLHSMIGEIEQIPPMYSAVKVRGKKLYEYARAGIEVERPSRIITISELILLSDIINKNNLTKFRFRVTCSKGTYVRTLAVMIGERLGYPAHMSHLIRTKSGDFDLKDCLTFEEVEEAIESGNFQKSLLSIGEALKDLPKLIIHDTLKEKVKNGAVLELPLNFQDLNVGSPIAVYGENRQCLAIYAKHPTKHHLMKPTKVLMNES